ncbi:hypothetical protein [Nannocystis sp.]|uniref:hypothetical protein n=1 Tax=Nannocystis sp. TaxID=1962667 RepID=UPI0025F75EB2|nr:hypothetical protein [Nannocystis sp.]MBK7827540.1 hypothetical protein [Nannocystis sp.]
MRELLACLVFAAIAGCGKSHGGPDEGSTGGAGASEAEAEVSTTVTAGSTGVDGDTTDACQFTELTQCDAPKLCPIVEVEFRPGPGAYAESELCAFAALRDRTPGLLEFNDCVGSGCSSLTLLLLADGRVFGDFASFDAEVGTSMFGPPRACELNEPAYFEACLAAFDSSCIWQSFTDCHAGASICECP